MQNNEDNLNAAEYVLGILDADERARFEQALVHDQAVREDVIYWENQLAEVGLELAPTPPPDTVWQQIKLETGVREPRHGIASCARWPWRTSAAAASLTAIAITVLLVVNNPDDVSDRIVDTQTSGAQISDEEIASAQGKTPAPSDGYQPKDVAIAWGSPAPSTAYVPPDFVGQLQDYASSVGWNVSGYSARGALEVSATGKPYTQLWDPATLELWLLPVNSYEEPISLGLLPADGAREISIPQHVASEFYTDYNKLAVSVEPPGGSSTGSPTGDILFITTLSQASEP